MKTNRIQKVIAAGLAAIALQMTGVVTMGNATAKDDLAARQTQPSYMAERVKTTDAFMAKHFDAADWPEMKTDPNYAATLTRFAYGEMEQVSTLSETDKRLITVATVAAQGGRLLPRTVKAALKAGVSPEAIKEVIYQIGPYIGMPRSLDALGVINDVFKAEKIKLPVADQATVTEETRFVDGLAVQKGIFGAAIDKMYETAPEATMPINYALSGYCFGDTYTRKALDLKQREMLTMTALMTLGDVPAQLTGHIHGNLNVGVTPQEIISVLWVCVPYIGFPHSLNALAAMQEVFKARGTKIE